MLCVTTTGHMKTQRRFWQMMNFFAYIFILHSWYLRVVIISKGSVLANLWKKASKYYKYVPIFTGKPLKDN